MTPGAVLAAVSQEKNDPLWIGVSSSSPDEDGWFSIDWYSKKSSARGREVTFELSQPHSGSRESVGSVLLQLDVAKWKFADRSTDIVLKAQSSLLQVISPLTHHKVSFITTTRS